MTHETGGEHDRVFDTIRTAFVEQLSLDHQAVTLDADLVEDLAIESIDAIDVIATIERVFDVKMHVREFMKIRTVADLVEIVVQTCGRSTGDGG